MKRLAAISLFVIAGTYGVARGQAPANQVLCQDGTTALASAGVCDNHGGVVAAGASVTRAKANPGYFETTERKRAGAGTEPMAFCKDGMVTNAGQGACVHNGGIERASATAVPATRMELTAFNPKAELTTPAATPAATPTARCRDGSLSYAGYVDDACAGNGGVSEWLAPAPK
jgi:hypothetical protein